MFNVKFFYARTLKKAKKVTEFKRDWLEGGLDSTKITPSSTMELRIYASSNIKLFRQKCRGSNEVVPMEADDTGAFKFILNLKPDKNSEGTRPLYPIASFGANHILLVIYGKDGKSYELWEIGLYARDGEIYYAEQKTFEGINENPDEFPKFVRPEIEADKTLKNGVGKVVFSNSFHGYGALQTNKGSAYFHWRQIDCVQEAEKGDIFYYKRLIQAPKESAFKMKVEGFLYCSEEEYQEMEGKKFKNTPRIKDALQNLPTKEPSKKPCPFTKFVKGLD